MVEKVVIMVVSEEKEGERRGDRGKKNGERQQLTRERAKERERTTLTPPPFLSRTYTNIFSPRIPSNTLFH
jgi:predicted Zn-dependent protease